MSRDVNSEDVGIRTFQIRKERAVERAIEKIRHKLGAVWQNIDSKDVDVLSWALGETWASMGFYDWDKIGFSFIDLENVKNIISLGQQVLDHNKLGTKAFEEIHAILDNLSSG